MGEEEVIEKVPDVAVKAKEADPANTSAETNPVEATNGAKEGSELAEGKPLNDSEEAKHKEAESEKAEQSKPSDRVREGQNWNNRSRGVRGGHGGRDRGAGQSSGSKYRKNIKSDLISQEKSSDPDAIRKQVEFYFSDSNLLQDKFLYTKVEGHKNVPVPISVIHSFKRMRHFQPVSAIVDALKESTSVNVVEDDTAIQRSKPLPEELKDKPMVEIEKVYEDKSMARSIYAKGFGEEQPSTQFDIEAFFARYGPTNSVRLRRSYNGVFKGSVFVEFDSEETAKAFLAHDPAPQWHRNDLQIKSKKQYCDDKVDDIAAGRVRPNEDSYPKPNSHDRGDRKRRRESPDYDQVKRDQGDGRDWRVRRDEDAKSGFKDHRNGGKHKGFGSSGRGGRGGRGGKDRNEESRRQKEEHEIPKTSVPSPTPERVNPQTEEPTKTPAKEDSDETAKTTLTLTDVAMDASSKKRARQEDDDGSEEQNASKRVDTKPVDS